MRRWAALLGVWLVAGCNQQMEDMPRYDSDEASPLFANGSSAQPPVEGTVAREEDIAVRPDENLPPIDLALLRRGQERYDIFCSPCHSVVGDGDGLVVRRGFPSPPSFHQTALRAAPDNHFYDVITHGYGAMYPYGSRVPPADRWAIVAYIRALQFSQNAEAGSLPPGERAKLEAVR